MERERGSARRDARSARPESARMEARGEPPRAVCSAAFPGPERVIHGPAGAHNDGRAGCPPALRPCARTPIVAGWRTAALLPAHSTLR